MGKSLGLTQGGIAYAWGENLFGRLGNNTTDPRSSPVTVVGGITNWQQLSAGGSHSLGVTVTFLL
jgi:alpha-tubulin suppressor-like RCC1 family protein